MFSKANIQEAFKLAISMVLMYWLALGMDWDMPKYGGMAIILVSLGTTGASLHKGILRIVGTTAGLVVGLFAVAAFSQDRWLMLVFLSGYLLVAGYFMQGSRYGYAWFVAAFLAPLVWASTYGDVGNTFHYATFRYLETSAGIVIYTAVSALLWPRRAGGQLLHVGAGLLTGLGELFGVYRKQLKGGDAPGDAAALRTKLAGTTAQLQTVLDAAYADTPWVIERKRVWGRVFRNARELGDAMESWHQTIDDCRRLDLDRIVPQLDAALGRCQHQCDRAAVMWQGLSPAGDSVTDDPRDRDLATPVRLDVDRAACGDLSHLERAALFSFAAQWNRLDAATSDLIGNLRALLGLDAERPEHAAPRYVGVRAALRWDPVRLINAATPVLCFALAYLFWIRADPPTGPRIPSTTATMALMLLLTPMNPIKLFAVMIGSLVVTVAPVYFFVMPQLDSGLQLLAVIFIYTFLFGCLGAVSPMLRMMPILMFTMTTGISNGQVFSFYTLAYPGIMFVLVFTAIVVVYMIWTPSRPERQLLRSLRRLFDGCERVLAGFAPSATLTDDDRRRAATRSRRAASVVQSVTKRLPAVVKQLDDKAFPDNSPDKVQRLLDGLESVALRIGALSSAHARAGRGSGVPAAALATMGDALRIRLQRALAAWGRCDYTAALDGDDGLKRPIHELESGLAATLATEGQTFSDEQLADTYAVVGCARGLVEAMAQTQEAAAEIKWEQWSAPRF